MVYKVVHGMNKGNIFLSQNKVKSGHPIETIGYIVWIDKSKYFFTQQMMDRSINCNMVHLYLEAACSVLDYQMLMAIK